MPSVEIERVREHWAHMSRVGPDITMQEMRLHDDTWSALTAEPGGVDFVETSVGGVPGLWLVPKGAVWDRVIMCLHGGGYMMGSRYSHRKMYGHLAKALGCRALLVEYRLAPEHPHPAQLEDAVAAYRGLLEEGIAPMHIAFAGDSAGGGLALGAQLRARDLGLPLPAATVLMSPWTDMSLAGPSYDENRDKDLVFRREMVGALVQMLLGPEPNVQDPYASPMGGPLAGLPPMHLQVGADEGLRDDSVVFARRAQEAGVEVGLEVFPGMLHTFQMAAGRAPEADAAIDSLAAWLRPRLDL
jgi:epsilon-lactone hydrolase